MNLFKIIRKTLNLNVQTTDTGVSTTLPPTQAIHQYSRDITDLTPPFQKTGYRNPYHRGMARNLRELDPITQNYLRIMDIEVIGSESIQVEFLDDMDEVPDELTRELNEAFKFFQRKDFTNSLYERDGKNLNELLSSILESVLIEGDAFLVDEKDGYQLYTGGAVPEYSMFNTRGGKHQDISGIIFNEKRQKVGYLFKDYHDQPLFNTSLNYKTVPADKVFHVFDDKDTNNVRGRSTLIPIMPILHFLYQWDNATLISLIKRATYPTVLQRTAATQFEEQTHAADTTLSDEEIAERIKTMKDRNPSRFGEVWDIDAGYEVRDQAITKVDAPEQKAQRYMQKIAAGLGIAAYRLFCDYSSAKFSSNRYGDHVDSELFRRYQNLLIKKVVLPIWQEDFLSQPDTNKIISKYVNRDNRHILNYIRLPNIIMKDFPPVELAKEATALIQLYEKGLMTWGEVRKKTGMHNDKHIFLRDQDMQSQNEKLKDDSNNKLDDTQSKE